MNRRQATTTRPTTYSKLKELGFRNVSPEGWLRSWLEIQARGLTGHIEVAGYPFDTKGWASPKPVRGGTNPEAEGWWPYEQVGYWVDGAVRCGHLLKDKKLLAKATKQMDYVLKNAERDGYLGPAHLKEIGAASNRWVHAVFFRALMAQADAMGDGRIVKALEKHYLSDAGTTVHYREACNLEPLLWTYERTGNAKLLELAKKIFTGLRKLTKKHDSHLGVDHFMSDEKCCSHGVSFCEMGKLGAVYYLYSGDKTALESSVHGFEKVDRDQMLVDGIPSSSEFMRSKVPMETHETCVISDYTWAAGYLLMATGDESWADRIERACFNAGMGAVTPNFKALQYFSGPNQMVADATSNHNAFHRGNASMAYRPNPFTECCAGNVHRFMPNYASRMWMRRADGGLVAALYGPGRASFDVDRTKVTVVQETDYPFSEEIDFRFEMEKPTMFPFVFRVPGWTQGASAQFNGVPIDLPLQPGSWTTVNGEFEHNDRITVRFPMPLRLSHWAKGGVALERGPLVYSLLIKERWEMAGDDRRQTEDFPAWNCYPDSAWNYALDLDEQRLSTVEVVHSPMPSNPWIAQDAPVKLIVPARKVKGWELERVDRFQSTTKGKEPIIGLEEVKKEAIFSPDLPDPANLPNRLGREVERITLVPYGATCLRVTIFPSVPKSKLTTSR